MTIYYEKTLPKDFSLCLTTNTEATSIATNIPSIFSCESDNTTENLLQGILL